MPTNTATTPTAPTAPTTIDDMASELCLMTAEHKSLGDLLKGFRADFDTAWEREAGDKIRTPHGTVSASRKPGAYVEDSKNRCTVSPSSLSAALRSLGIELDHAELFDAIKAARVPRKTADGSTTIKVTA